MSTTLGVHILISVFGIIMYCVYGYKYWKAKDLTDHENGKKLHTYKTLYYSAFILFFLGNLLWAIIVKIYSL